MRGANAVAQFLFIALVVLLHYTWPALLWLLVHIL